MSTELLRQVAVLVAATVVIPYFVLVFAVAAQKQRMPYGNATIMPTLFIGIAMFFLTRRVGARFDETLNANNAAWLVGYGCGAIGFYFAGLFAWHAGGRQGNVNVGRALALGLVVALGGMGALYLRSIQATAEWPSRVPRTWQEALFSSFFFGYVGAVSLLALDASLWTIATEEHDGAVQRALLALLGAAFATLCFFLKIAFGWLHVAGFNVDWMDRAALWCMVIALIGLLGAILPQRIHNRFAAYPPLRTWRALSDLRQFQHLHKRIRAAQPELVPAFDQPPWWRQLLHADEALYQAVIALHDARRVVHALPPDAPAYAEGQSLLDNLATVDTLDDQSYAATLAALRAAAQKVKEQEG